MQVKTDQVPPLEDMDSDDMTEDQRGWRDHFREEREWNERVEGILDDYYQEEEEARATRQTTRLRAAQALNDHNEQRRETRTMREIHRQANGRFGPISPEARREAWSRLPGYDADWNHERYLMFPPPLEPME